MWSELFSGTSGIVNIIDNLNNILGDKKPESKVFNLKMKNSFDLPVIFGTVKLSGELLWQSKPVGVLRDVSNGVSGLFSSISSFGVSNILGSILSLFSNSNKTETIYLQSFAVAICQGRVDKLVEISIDDEVVDLRKVSYRFYDGSQSVADPTLAKVLGIGNVPSFNGVCYIVFDGLNISDFGNRIPKFEFKIIRTVQDDLSLELRWKIGGVTMIPASGEFSLDTVLQEKYDLAMVGNKVIEGGFAGYSNKNNNSNDSDAIEGLNNMELELPNLKWVSPVVSWFGDSLDIASCVIKPRVENRYLLTKPDSWFVAGYTRDNAPLVSRTNDVPNYGGTISDAAVVRYLKELKRRGYKVIFYPMLFMDIDQKPWRGRMGGNARDVAGFFRREDGYNQFILHYANLVKGLVDAFIIGSELVGITKITSGNGVFPAVDELRNLAGLVRQVLGSGVKLTYAADWSEYHHSEGGYYNLDSLWADSNIDMIGIDAYFPITQDVSQAPTRTQVKNGWTSGEGYEFYYTNADRTVKASLSPQYAWKNLRWFVSNYHINPNGVRSAWVPNSKKIWFTEYGFPSVDGCANQPNVFYNPESSESGFPRMSTGVVSFEQQRTALLGTADFLTQNADIIENAILWTYDARPFPYYPTLKNIWADGDLWQYGHWINGKLLRSHLAGVLVDLFKTAGVDSSQLTVAKIQDDLDGFVIDSDKKIKDILAIFSTLYVFKYYIKNDVLMFEPVSFLSTTDINESDILFDTTQNVAIFSSTTSNKNFIDAIEIKFTNSVNFNEDSIFFPQDKISQQADKFTMRVSQLQITKTKALEIAKLLYFMFNNSQSAITLKLPYELYRKVLENNAVNFKGEMYFIVSQKLTDDMSIVELSCVKMTSEFQAVINSAKMIDYAPVMPKLFNQVQPSELMVLDLPKIAYSVESSAVDQFVLHLVPYSKSVDWRGCWLYYKTPYDAAWQTIGFVNTAATLGEVVDINQIVNTDLLDKVSNPRIFIKSGALNEFSLLYNELYSSTDNIALLGDEIIKIGACAVSGNVVSLNNLIRNLASQDVSVFDSSNRNFVMLDKSLVTLSLPKSLVGKEVKFKAVSLGGDFDSAKEISFIPRGASLLNYPAVNVNSFVGSDNSIKFTWLPLSQNSGWSADISSNPNISQDFSNNLIITSNQKVKVFALQNEQSFMLTSDQQMLYFGIILKTNPVNFSCKFA